MTTIHVIQRRYRATGCNFRRGFLLGVVLGSFAMASGRADDSIYLQLEDYSPSGDGTVNHLQTSATPLSFSVEGTAFGMGTASASYNGIDFDVTAISASSGGSSYQTAQMYVNATVSQGYLITTDSSLDGTGGTVVFTSRLTGSYTPSSYLGSGGLDRVTVKQDGNNKATYGVDNSGADYGPPEGTLDFAYGLTLSSAGAGVTWNYGISALASPGSPAPGGSVAALLSASLEGKSIAVYDAGNHAVNFTATSAGGTARGSNVASGQNFDGFALTNSVGKGSTLSLLGGTAGAARYVVGNFVAAPSAEGLQAVSDAVDFSGTSTDLVVLQLSYDVAALTAAGLTDADVHMLWLDPSDDTYKDAFHGDSDGGAAHQFIAGAYTGGSEFALGDWGVDVVNHDVWAIVDHNSEFVAGVVAAPEPSPAGLSLAALIAGGLIHLRRRRRV